MRIAVSLLALRPGRIGGAETYIRNLLEHMPREAPGDTLLAVMDRDVAAVLPTPGFERVVVPKSGMRIVAERLLEAFTPWRALAAERIFREIDAEVVLHPQQSVFPKRAPGKAVLTVVDVQHLYHPENITRFDRLFRPAIYPYSMARADHMVAISEFTRNTVVQRCGIPPEKVTSIPLGYALGSADDVSPTARVAAPYLFYPAATFAHKNHAELIRSYATLRRRGDVKEKLVFTGMQTPAWKALARLIHDLGVEGNVVHLGFLPYPDVRGVYAGADAVVFPSRYEGFGIPVLEAAMEFRKKVITSRLPVFDEIGVPAERQIDFGDPDALLAALRLPGPTVLAYPPFTWAECARRTLAVLRQVGGGRLDARAPVAS
jgi:glycosyltransferase involved in cell wall biosynthesis